MEAFMEALSTEPEGSTIVGRQEQTLSRSGFTKGHPWW
jgi:hypothetical protein